MVDSWLAWLSALIEQSLYLAPLLALLAGLLVSFTPCSVAAVPLLLAYVGGTGGRSTKRSFRLSLTFVAGSALTFSVLGALAALAGRLIGNASGLWYIFLGVLMVVMALQTWGLITVIPSSRLTAWNKKRGYAGAFLAGILGGIFSSACSTPVLIVLLAIVVDRGHLLFGIFLLFCYSVGHGILAVAAGTVTGLAGKMAAKKRASSVIKTVMGSIILLIGFYMFYLGF